jgi:hypothetical protein
MRFYPLALAVLLAGCAADAQKPDLTAASTAATNAAAVAHNVESEIREARLLDLVEKETLAPSPKVPPALVCVSSPSAELTAKELGAYADAINAVAKVAAKPKDASYAGYLQQFKKNREAIEAAAKTPEEASEKDLKQTQEAQARCSSALISDLQEHLLGPQIEGNRFVITALPAAVADINGMILGLLSVTEQAQRAVAVRKAAKHMIITLQAATQKLSDPPEDTDYRLKGESSSRLENTLAIHRWFAAQRLQGDWDALHAAQAQKNKAGAWEAADRFAADAQSYVKLSANDPQKLLKDLQKAVDDAARLDDKTSVEEIVESLANIGTALAGVDDKYKAFRKTVD